MKMTYEMYTKEVLKHFKHPKNQGIMKNPSAVGEVGNIQCGDVMKLYLKIKKDKRGRDMISDIKFECLGCVVAIANTSMLTTMVKGMTLRKAMNIKEKDILKKLKKVPITKVHCSVLAADALAEAIYNYYQKSNLPIPKKMLERHERIKKTIENLEDRHKEYIEFERNLMKRK